MTKEWGPPLTGEEIKALKGRIDPSVWLLNGLGYTAQYGPWHNSNVFDLSLGWSLPANHPYYKVREYNQKHGTNLVLHDGSDKVPDDFASGVIMFRDGDVSDLECNGAGAMWWNHNDATYDIIAYTPKPKESEVTEQFPSDEAFQYLMDVFDLDGSGCSISQLREDERSVAIARLIQQYEPDRLKSAVDVAAEEYAVSEWTDEWEYEGHRKLTVRDFKAGAVWRKESGNGWANKNDAGDQ